MCTVDRGSLRICWLWRAASTGRSSLQRPAVRSLGSRPCSFQAVGKGAMPLRLQSDVLRPKKVLEASGAAVKKACDPRLPARRIRDPFRPDASAAAACFGKLYEALRYCRRMRTMMNVLTWYDSDGWTSCVFAYEAPASLLLRRRSGPSVGRPASSIWPA